MNVPITNSLCLLLVFLLNSCMQLHVGDNIRSTGNPIEVYEVSLDENKAVYAEDNSYFVQIDKQIRYTYPSSFDSSAVFGGSSTYHHSEQTSESAWFRLEPNGECYVFVTRTEAPNLNRCKVIPYKDLEYRYQHIEKDVFGEPLPEPEITDNQKWIAGCFDYCLDPLGTATVNTLIYGGIAAAFIFISPSKMIYDKVK